MTPPTVTALHLRGLNFEDTGAALVLIVQGPAGSFLGGAAASVADARQILRAARAGGRAQGYLHGQGYSALGVEDGILTLEAPGSPVLTLDATPELLTQLEAALETEVQPAALAEALDDTPFELSRGGGQISRLFREALDRLREQEIPQQLPRPVSDLLKVAPEHRAAALRDLEAYEAREAERQVWLQTQQQQSAQIHRRFAATLKRSAPRHFSPQLRDVLYGEAWDRGHSSGVEEIELAWDNLCELAGRILQAQEEGRA